MKIASMNKTRHIASISVAVIFILFALGSSSLFQTGELESPCVQITPVSSAYVVTVKVIDELTGKPIPNATVNMQVEHTNFSYLGEELCQVSPAKPSYSQIVRQTNATGLVTVELATLSYHTSIDRTYISLSVTAENYSSSQASKVVKGESPIVQFNIKLIDLTDQP